jgi:hypothetical protein
MRDDSVKTLYNRKKQESKDEEKLKKDAGC